LLIDGSDGFYDEVEICLLVGKNCLLVFEFSSEGRDKLTKGAFDCCFEGMLGYFNVAFLCVSCKQSFPILEEHSWVTSDEAIVLGLMVVIGWVVWVVSD
jgi:hypothetical protein